MSHFAIYYKVYHLILIYKTMTKTSVMNLFIKSVFLLSLIAFLDFLFMVVLGCTACALGSASTFYSCTYCSIGKIVLLVSAIAFIVAIAPDIRSMLTNKKFNL